MRSRGATRGPAFASQRSAKGTSSRAARSHRCGKPPAGGAIRSARKPAVGDERRYFAVAQDRVDRWIDVDGAPKAVALLDPMTGRSGLARLRVVRGRTQVFVQLDPGHSLIIRMSPRT